MWSRPTIAASPSNVTRHGGFIARYMGDGVLSYFGYPVANEDDAERAVRAGIAVVEAVPRLNTVAGPPSTLRARVGIATGMVIVGHLIGAGEVTRKGSGRRRAESRVAPAVPRRTGYGGDRRQHAAPDRRACSTIAISAQGDQGLRAAGPRLARAARELDRQSFEALRAGGGASLFGREDELALLLHRWREAQRGEGRVVLLSGEAGIGKSRLAAALENRLLSEPHTRRRYLCSPHHQDTLLHPVIAQLTRAAGFEREDDAAAKLRKLAALVPTGASAEEFALIADLLSLPVPAEANLAELTPQRRKERTFAAILRQLERLTDENPVLAIIEDLHWADPTTLELLSRVVEQIEHMRLLLVVTSRPDVQPDWIDHPVVSVQPLGRFDRRQANALIDGVAGGSRLPRRCAIRSSPTRTACRCLSRS